MADAPGEVAIAIPAGVVAVTTWGLLQAEMARAVWEMRSVAERHGLMNIAWQTVPGTLVDKARNDAARGMLQAFKGEAQWILYVDGDMVPPPDALLRILTTAYHTHAWADIVGAYCTLRGDMALPTIDTGTGTWESWYPGSGVREVIRTGAAFLLVKRHVFERIPQPWFAIRVPNRPIDFLLEVDNFARCKLNGQNPFRGLPGEPWERLVAEAARDPSMQPGAFVPGEVGEDSNFCDRARFMGCRIVVDTNLEIPHLDQTVANWQKHKSRMQEIETQWLAAVGVAS